MVETFSERIVRELQTNHHESVANDSRRDLETRAAELIERLGIAEKLNKLDPKNSEIITEGIATLWIINSLGRKVEADDLEIIGGPKVEKLAGEINTHSGVESVIDEVEQDFHGKIDWFDEAVTTLVDAALDPIPETYEVSKGKVVDLAAKYVGKLDIISRNYIEVLAVSGLGEKERVRNYIHSERPSSINWLKVHVDEILAPTVKKLTPFVNSE